MAGKPKGHEVIPSAKRLIRSLRDMGYDFSAAVADLIDNSIAAQASLVAIDIEFDGDDSWVRIADNGIGMTTVELKEAMRYGAEREYEDDDLGKFGLGLKTASMSQCQRLSVASRFNPQRADVAAFCWDLDHIEKTNRWEILPLDRNGLGPAVRRPLKDTTGTVVLWQKLDRILGYKHPYGEMARKRLLAMCRELEGHLGMVFHRFLAGEVPRKRLKILVNGNEVGPWDPYCRKEVNTKRLTEVSIPIEQDGIKGEIRLDPFVLPHQEKFSTPAAFSRASGPSKWNRQQGFYIYRANRMIQSGGWCNLRTIDEHTKLARVALSFSPKLDEAFKINVAKMRVQLPPQVRDLIEEAVAPVVKLARLTYDREGKPKTPPKPGPTENGKPKPSDRTSGAKETGDYRDQTQSMWTLREIQTRLNSVATAKERAVISSVFERLKKTLT